MAEAKTAAKRTKGTAVPKLTVPVARANDDEEDDEGDDEEEEEEKDTQEDHDDKSGDEGKAEEPKTGELKSPAVAQLRISKQDAEEVTFVLRSQLTQAVLMKQFERRGMDARRVMIDSIFVRDARPKADRKEGKSQAKVSAEQVCAECNFLGDEPPVDRDWERAGFASDKFYRVEKCALGSPLENRWPFFGDYPGAVPAHVASAYLDDGACPASTALWRAAQAHQPETNHLVVTRFSAPTRGSVPYPPTAKHLVNDSFIFDYNLGARRQLLFRQAPPTGRNAKSVGGGGGGGGGNKSRKKQLLKQDVMHTVLLEDGSLFVLGPRDAQETVREAVVDAASADRVGVSLAFRATKTFKKPSGMKALVRKLGHAKPKVARAPTAPKPHRCAAAASSKKPAAVLVDEESTDSDVAVVEGEGDGSDDEEEEEEDAEKGQAAAKEMVEEKKKGGEKRQEAAAAAADKEKSDEKRRTTPTKGATATAEVAGRKRKLEVADEKSDSDREGEQEADGDDDEDETEKSDGGEEEEEEEGDKAMTPKADLARADRKSVQASS